MADDSDGAKDYEFEDEVGEGDEDNEAVQVELTLDELAAPPGGCPVGQPEEVTDESNCKQQHQLLLVILYACRKQNGGVK